MSVEIRLTPYEMMMGAMVGIMREIQAIKRGLKDKIYDVRKNGWTTQVEGALGEYCAAKALGVTWTGTVGTFKGRADILSNIEVRTRSREDYDLLVRANDDPESIYILVLGTCPVYRVFGYMPGREAMQERWLNEYGNLPPAYFVPQNELYPIERLVEGMD